MEDREILEHIALAYKDNEKVNSSLVNIKTSTLITNGELAQAIENLLKENENLKQAIEINKNLYEKVCNENKELEEENKSIKYSIESLRADRIFLKDLVNDLQEQIRNSIPTSLVKEKIEELEKEVKDYQCEENRINLYQRKVLQELLREEK